jgi:hypothetical protein
MDFQIPEVRNVINTLENERAQLGLLLENLSKLQLSPRKITELFLQGKADEVLKFANLAIACEELWNEWKSIAHKHYPSSTSFSHFSRKTA